MDIIKEKTKQILKSLVVAVILCVGLGWLASVAGKNGYVLEGFILSVTTTVITIIYLINQMRYIYSVEKEKKKLKK
jgi:hypothetical protein